MKFYDEISPISMKIYVRVEVVAVSRNGYGVEKTVDTHNNIDKCNKILC